MQLWSVLNAKPNRVLSRVQRLVSLAGLYILAVLLVAHSVALSVILWQPAAGVKIVVLLAFSWAISLLGLWMIFRFVKTVRAIPETVHT